MTIQFGPLPAPLLLLPHPHVEFENEEQRIPSDSLTALSNSHLLLKISVKLFVFLNVFLDGLPQLINVNDGHCLNQGTNGKEKANPHVDAHCLNKYVLDFV